MKIGFDIGGVLSKYPEKFLQLIADLLGCDGQRNSDTEIYFITDQYLKELVIKTHIDNEFTGEFLTNKYIWQEDYDKLVHCADYEKHGNMSKALLIKELGIDIFIDDFEAYLSWDSTLGPQPILLKVMPDVFKPYHAPTWKQEGGDFGRRVYTHGNDS